MMRKPGHIISRTSLIFLALAGDGGRQAVAQSLSCTNNRGMYFADPAIDKVATWTALRRWQREYGGCDNGETAEAVSDTVATLLTQRWDELMQIGREVEDDTRFQSFVMRHIDAVGFDDQAMKRAETFARERCTPSNRQLCRRIRVALAQVGQ